MALKPKTFTSQATGICHFNPLFTAVPNYHDQPGSLEQEKAPVKSRLQLRASPKPSTFVASQPKEIFRNRFVIQKSSELRNRNHVSSFIHRSTDLFQIYARTSLQTELTRVLNESESKWHFFATPHHALLRKISNKYPLEASPTKWSSSTTNVPRSLASWPRGSWNTITSQLTWLDGKDSRRNQNRSFATGICGSEAKEDLSLST